MALAAMLGAALLPNGQLPKLAGRCGQALCYCPPDLQTNSCPGSGTVKYVHRDVLTLGHSLFSGEESPGAAFQVVIGGAVLAGVPAVNRFESEELAAVIIRAFALKQSVFELSTPPPRA